MRRLGSVHGTFVRSRCKKENCLFHRVCSVYSHLYRLLNTARKPQKNKCVPDSCYLLRFHFLTLSFLPQSHQPPFLSTPPFLQSQPFLRSQLLAKMHLTNLLLAAFFGILSHLTYAQPKQPSHPHGYQYVKRDSSSSSSSSSSGNNTVGSTASFTQYSPCNSPSQTSCGWYSSTGYNAAISQAVYGGYPGSGPSAACGVCWLLTPEFPGANAMVVKVNNLCPDGGNPLCAMPAGECFPFPFLLFPSTLSPFPASRFPCTASHNCLLVLCFQFCAGFEWIWIWNCWLRIMLIEGVQTSISISICARIVGPRRPCSALRARSRLMGRRWLWIVGSGVAVVMFVCRVLSLARLGAGSPLFVSYLS